MVSYGGLRKRVLAFERSVFRLGGLGKTSRKKTARRTGLDWVLSGNFTEHH